MLHYTCSVVHRAVRFPTTSSTFARSFSAYKVAHCTHTHKSPPATRIDCHRLWLRLRSWRDHLASFTPVPSQSFTARFVTDKLPAIQKLHSSPPADVHDVVITPTSAIYSHTSTLHRHNNTFVVGFALQTCVKLPVFAVNRSGNLMCCLLTQVYLRVHRAHPTNRSGRHRCIASHCNT